MQITCIDRTDGRLFFADDFFWALNNLKYEIYVKIPQNLYTIYGNYFNNFPKIKSGTEKMPDIATNIIFSDFRYLKKLKDIGNSLIYPLLKNTELEEFRAWIDHSGNELMLNMIPVGPEQSNSFIIQPEAKWAMDMLNRQIGDPFLKGKSFLISAGPTIEDIDPVRYLSNRSSGKMGIALARAAYINGANVQLILGPTSISAPTYLPILRIRSAEEMYQNVLARFLNCDVYIGSAAIADFTPAKFRHEKIKKNDSFSELILQPTKDILKEISAIRKKQLLIGFSVETTNMIENSKVKMNNKNLDMVVVNNPKDKGAAFDADTNVVSIIYKNGTMESWPIMSKQDVAYKLMLKIKELL